MGFAPKFAFWFSSWAVIALIGVFVRKPLDFGYFYYFFLFFGLFLMAYGLLLNAIAGRTLKRYGHFDIKRGIKKPEKLVTVGIYSCMRHPSQFGSIFFGVGIAFLTGNIYSMLMAGWFAFFAMYFILAIEERETIREFGASYCKFLKERRPFTFSLQCLKTGLRALK